MYTELHSITFGVVMTLEQFKIMDTYDYEDIMKWFPEGLNVFSLNWDGHFGTQLVVTCDIDDVAQVGDVCVAVRDIVRAMVVAE